MIYLISFIIAILFFLLLCYIFNLKYLLLIFLGLLFLLLFVLNIKGSEKIITNYLSRKNINYTSLLNNKYNLFLYYFIVLFIVSVYIWSISSRLFIIINNIFVYFLNGELEKMSLFLSIIIVILLVSIILIWMDILNKKYEKGRYNKFSILIGLFLVFSLLYSIIIFVTGWGIEYIYILKIVSQLTILIELFTFFINSDLILLNVWEKEILPNLNINKINFKYYEIKNYINMKILSNKIFYDNNKIWYTKDINCESNISFYTKYKKLLIKGRSNNLIMRSIYFILDLILLIIEKFYFINNIKIKHIFNIKWNYKIAMLPIGNINQNNNIKNSHGNIINNSNIIININIFDGNTETKSNSTSNEEVLEKRENLFQDENKIKIKEKKRRLSDSIFLKDASLAKIRKKVYYPNIGYFNVIDICNMVINNMANLEIMKNESIKLSHLSWIGTYSDKIDEYQKLIELPYYDRNNEKIGEMHYTILNYLRAYNHAITSRLSVISFIDKHQISELTKFVGKFITQPLWIEFLSYTEEDKNNAIASCNFPCINSVSFSNENKNFSIVQTVVPNNEYALNILSMLERLRNHSYILDSSLNCTSLITKIGKEAFIIEKDFRSNYIHTLEHLSKIKSLIFNAIIQAEIKGQITTEDREIYIRYYTKYIARFENILKIRFLFLSEILVKEHIPRVTIEYLGDNFNKWEFNSKKVFKEIEKLYLDSSHSSEKDLAYIKKNYPKTIQAKPPLANAGLNSAIFWLNESKSMNPPHLNYQNK